MNAVKVCVMGLGYIGLPTATMFAAHGCKVIGVDVNEEIVSGLNNGKVTIKEPNLDVMVQDAVRSGNFVAATKPEEADAFIIAVPTPITMDKKADLSYVRNATEMIVPFLRKGNIVVVESTVPPGTLEDLVVPILEKSGLKIGDELYVGHAPERVLPGKILQELVNNDRIIGGINRTSAEKIRDLYKIFVKGEIYLTDAKTAEMCKVVENTFRDVNIAFANELAKICERLGLNVWEVIELANKHPRVNILQPGPGVGGHCLAVDPWFIVEKAPDLAKIIKLSRETNDTMPRQVLERIDQILANIEGTKRVSILGITYKPNTDDLRESPIVKLIELMEKRRNYEIRVYDPYVKSYKYQVKDLTSFAEGSDLLVLAVHHEVFKDLPIDRLAKVMRNRNVLDTRNFFNREKIENHGFRYMLLGDGKNSQNTVLK
uniref:UDP-N-acetyl-D-mannosamine dehydrogenase n=1 Tax=Fervidobacterium pennivorans TaxID=93466 RepID=A0A7V4KDR3_FERPE